MRDAYRSADDNRLRDLTREARPADGPKPEPPEPRRRNGRLADGRKATKRRRPLKAARK